MSNTTKDDMILSDIKERTESLCIHALAGRVIGQRNELDAVKAERDLLKSEVDRLKRNTGCARNQGSTQFCAEAVELAKERDALRAEVEKLKTEVDGLNGLRKYHAALLSQEWQTTSKEEFARAAEQAEVYMARLGVPPAGAAGSAKKLDGIPIRPTVLLLASCACSIAGFYSEQARWFLIPALAFIIIALFCT